MNQLKWAYVGLFIASLIFSRDSARLTRLGEKAYGEHFEQPANPVHLARFNAFAARSAGSNTVATICGLAAGALAFLIDWN